MYSQIKELAEKYISDAVALRWHLHKNPELSFKEFETTGFIKSELEKMGIPTFSPLETGCVGILEGGKNSDRVIALRADIDALPIQEEGEAKKDFMSKTPGIAHCCGHDAHTANLLITARILNELRDQIEGKVVLVFQAGEEKLPGGGKLLRDSGFLQSQKVQAIYGLHTAPFYEPGIAATKSGALMASADEFEIELIGKGGHAARAHEAVDPIVMTSQFINAVQSIASRSIDPTEPVVVTIGKIEGGSAHNIIPEEVKIWGTVRTLASETADLVQKRLDEIAKGITSAAGGTYKMDYHKGYPPVVNTEAEAQNVLQSANLLFGENSALNLDRPIMAAEDFSFYQQEFPGAFFFVGSGADRSDSKYPWHHPKYNVDDDFFKVALPLMATIVFNH